MTGVKKAVNKFSPVIVFCWFPTFAPLSDQFVFSFSSQVFFASVRSGGSSQVYFMTLGRTSLLSW